MTEAEWATGDDPYLMLRLVCPMSRYLTLEAGHPLVRKKARLACAACRYLWPLLSPACRSMAETYEQSLDDAAAAPPDRGVFEDSLYAAFRSALTGPARSAVHLLHGILFEGWNTNLKDAVIQEHREGLAGLVRDVFGNPFRPAALAPEWLTTDAVLLATGIWEERAFDRMPILADALQDAGCTDEDLLAHCRDTAPQHARGCWAVDLIVGVK